MKTIGVIGLWMVTGVLLLANPAGAQDSWEEAMMKAATPGPEHQFLASLAGSWSITTKSWPEPGKDPIIQTGKSTSRMVLGGRFLQEEVDMTGEPMPFSGMGLSGYDNTQGEYFTFWMDTMGTGGMLMHGQLDPSGKTMRMTGTFPDPISKQDMIFRSVTTYETLDRYTAVFYMTMPGTDEMKSMEMTGQRVR